MEKLDMTDLVFIGFPFDEIDAAYKKLESILDKNIYCCVSDFKKYDITNFGIFSEPYGGYDFFCLSTLPYFSKYSHVENNVPGSFTMFTKKYFYLIFSDEILNLYDSRKGHMSDEYYIRGSMPVKEHLIGIGNAKPTIDYRVVLAYFLFKYYNNEISYEEFCKETFRFSNLKNSYFDLNKYHIAELSERLGLKYQHSDFGKSICELEQYPIENYLVGNDEQLSNICKKHNIKMFDQTGFLVDKKSQLQTLQMMKEYILENIDKTYDVCKQYYLQKYKK